MSKFPLPNQVTSLPLEQQQAIHRTLVQSGLLTEDGKVADLNVVNMPSQHKAALNASLREMGVQENIEVFGLNLGCVAARVAEAAAVVACAAVPGGQIAIAACIAAAHAVADEACK